ncbi:MAG: permease-like cell division protein FtsX [bacterium]|nr:permease-like cell division protein FtsX [bacterium]
MFTVISRIVHYGLKNFWRNPLLSTATVAIMTLSLLVFAGLLFANIATSSMISFLKDKIDVSVYFKIETPEDQILAIKEALKSLPEVKEVTYISSDQALKDFTEKHQNDETISQSIIELDGNPLEASLSIKAQQPDQYAAIKKYFEDPEIAQYIDGTPQDAENQLVIDRLVGIINAINNIGIAVTVALSLIGGLVVFNTVRLAIYSNRDEIGIMRAVGASNMLVRGPYVIEGIISGALAALFSIAIIGAVFTLMPLFYDKAAYFDISIPGFNPKQYFVTNIAQLLFYQLVFGMGIAAVSSFMAVRRYLKN